MPEHGYCELIDGGFVANNPTLFALSDALNTVKVPPEFIRILSVGTGRYPRKFRLCVKALETFSPTILTLATTSSNTVETIRNLFFDEITTLRIDDAFTDTQYKTDFLESRSKKLRKIYHLGRKSFGANVSKFQEFFLNSER